MDISAGIVIMGQCLDCPHFVDQLGRCWLDYEDIEIAMVPRGCPLDRLAVSGLMWGMPVMSEA